MTVGRGGDVDVDGACSRLTSIAFVNSLIGACYYLRVLVFMYMREPAAGAPVATARAASSGKAELAPRARGARAARRRHDEYQLDARARVRRALYGTARHFRAQYTLST